MVVVAIYVLPKLAETIKSTDIKTQRIIAACGLVQTYPAQRLLSSATYRLATVQLLFGLAYSCSKPIILAVLCIRAALIYPPLPARFNWMLHFVFIEIWTTRF